MPTFQNILSCAAKKETDIAISLEKFNKEYISGEDLATTITNNEIKHIKIIKSQENKNEF